jgi:hypothetical protein
VVIRANPRRSDRALILMDKQNYRISRRIVGCQIPSARRALLAPGHQPVVIRTDLRRSDRLRMAVQNHRVSRSAYGLPTP